jgi:hypothetical protein
VGFCIGAYIFLKKSVSYLTARAWGINISPISRFNINADRSGVPGAGGPRRVVGHNQVLASLEGRIPMAKGGTVKTALCAGGVGLLAGLLVIFIGIVGVITRSKPEAPEPTYAQLQEAAFMGMTRGDWIFKKMEPNQVLGRIAVVQSQTGDLEATIGKIEDKNLRVDAVRNQAVYDYLHNKVGPTERPTAADIDAAKKIALSIKDQLLRADALRRVGEVQLRADPAGAKITLQEAVTAVNAPVPPTFEPPPPLFNPTTLLWPVGLAIFGILLALCLKPLIEGLAPARGRVVAEEEEEEEDEDEEKAEAVPAEAMPAEAVPEPAMAAEMPVADVPMEPVAAEVPAADMALAAPPGAPPSQLARAGADVAPGAAAAVDPKKTMIGRAGPANPTMLTRSGPANPTMLASKGPAAKTQLAQEGALPTKIADQPDALPLPNLPPTGKTQKK